MGIGRYVILFSCIWTSACTLDVQLSKLASTSHLSFEWNEDNFSVSANNVRSFNLKGHCDAGSEVLLKIGSLPEVSVLCASDHTFAWSADLDGIPEGSVLVVASQEDTMNSKLLTAEKTIVVDTTPPLISFDVPDTPSNFPLSSLKANYPLSGTCSDPFSLIHVTSTGNVNLFVLCSAAGQWQTAINLSADDSSSIEFYAKHIDAAGNISATSSQTIRAAQWLKVSPAITSTGFASYRQAVRFGDSGRVLVTVPLRNDDFVDLGVVNYDGTGLTRISLGVKGVDAGLPLIAAPKYNRAFYGAAVPGRAQLKELHSVKIDGSDDKIILGPTADNPVGGVISYLLSPDQKTIVARGDFGTIDNEFNLYAVAVATGTVTKLNGTMVLGGDVREYIISPDSSEVVFRMDKDVDETVDLYAVKMDGTNLRKLNTAMGAGKTVHVDYKFSPDGNWVYFKDNHALASGYDLSIVSLKTGELINLTNATNSGVNEGVWSPDSKQIAFRADLDLVGCVGLYRYDIAGANRILLSTACDNAFKDVYTYAWSPDSSKVAFGNVTVSARFNLFIVDRDGSNKIQLIAAAANYTGVNTAYKENGILITPDNQYVLFQADIKGTANANSAAMRLNFYTIKSDGTGAPVLLHPAGINTNIRDFPLVSMSPSGDRIAFATDLVEDAKYEMYLAATDGSSQRIVSPPIPNALGSVYVSNIYQYFFDWGHDTLGMIIDENIESVGVFYLASLKLPVTAPKNIALPSILSGDVTSVSVSKNRQKAFFRVNPTVDSEMHLYAADADGTNVQKLTKNYAAGGGVLRSFASTNDGSKVVYISDQDTPGQEELYIADTAGGGPLKINTAIAPADGDILDFVIAESAGKVFYRGGISSSTHTDIYSVNFDGTGTTKITPNYLAAGTISSWSLSADESYIAVNGDFYTDEILELVTASAAGGAFTRVNAALTGGRDALGFKISPDSGWICYWGDLVTDTFNDTRVVNKGTGTVYTVASAVSAAQGSSSCEFTPDSAFVVTAGDWAADGKTILKSFKLSDQSLVTLNPGLPSASTTSQYVYVNNVTAKRVITSSETSSDVVEIYSMNYDGTDLRKISQNPYAGGKVNANQGVAMRVLDDNDGTIVYSGLIDRFGRWDLFAVKWDGSSSRKLVTLNSFADIYDFAVTEGSSTVLFRADNDKDGVVGLYSINIDGTGLQNRTPGLAAGTMAMDGYQQTTTHVMFRSDAYRSQLMELFADAL